MRISLALGASRRSAFQAFGRVFLRIIWHQEVDLLNNMIGFADYRLLSDSALSAPALSLPKCGVGPEKIDCASYTLGSWNWLGLAGLRFNEIGEYCARGYRSEAFWRVFGLFAACSSAGSARFRFRLSALAALAMFSRFWLV